MRSNKEPSMGRLLRENNRLARENNRLLRKLHRANILSFWSRIFFFLIIIGVPIFIYRYYLEDYVTDFLTTYQDLKEDVAGLRELPEKLPF